MIKCDFAHQSQPASPIMYGHTPRFSRYRFLLAFVAAGTATASAHGVDDIRLSDRIRPLEIVVERDASRVAAAIQLARLHAELQNWESAWRILERSAPHAKQDGAYQGFRGTVLRQLKRPEEAAEAYRRAVTLTPDDGRWWLGLGLALDESGRRKEARAAFSAARERSESLPPELRKIAEKRGY